MGTAAQVIEELRQSPPKREAPGGGSEFRPQDGTTRALPKKRPAPAPVPVARATQRHVD